MADCKEPNRKTIRSLDWMSQKAFNQMKRSKARAAELGMSYEQYLEEENALMISFLKVEITYDEFMEKITALKGA